LLKVLVFRAFRTTDLLTAPNIDQYVQFHDGDNSSTSFQYNVIPVIRNPVVGAYPPPEITDSNECTNSSRIDTMEARADSIASTKKGDGDDNMDKAASMSHTKGNGDDSIISTGTYHKICYGTQ
jgi:hypothetical protein